MSLLSEINMIFKTLIIPVQTGVFSGKAPDQYAVFTPLTDTLDLFADNLPSIDIQEVRISLFNKGNYLKMKNLIVCALLKADITITECRYIAYETNTGYHHYAIDIAKSYEMEE